MNVGTYALCLADRPERRANVEAELGRVGLAYSVFEAIRPSDALGFSSPGRRGCYESHLTLLRRAMDDGVDMAVFCQDDLWIPRTFDVAWPLILATLAVTTWQFIHLGYVRNFFPSVGAVVEPVGPHVGRLLAHDLLGAHFYAVHRDTIPDLVDFLQHRYDHGPRGSHDGAVNDFRRERGLYPLVAVPNLGEQMPSPSNITPQTNPLSRAMHTMSALGPALGAYRGVRRGFFEMDSAWAMRREVRRLAASAADAG